MGSNEGSARIVLGIFGATGVVLISYLLFKKYESKHKGKLLQTKEKPSLTSKQESYLEQTVSQNVRDPVEEIFETSTRPETSTEASLESARDDQDKENESGDSVNQNSFIIVDSGEDAGLPEERHLSKKSDRSSDESSYDVIEDERLEETVEDESDERDFFDKGDEEGANESKPSHQYLQSNDKDQTQTTQDSFQDANEGSMIVIEHSEPSVVEISGSSFYQSADDSVESTESQTKEAEFQHRKEDASEDLIEKTQAEEEDQFAAADETVINTAERKSEAETNESVLDSSSSKDHIFASSERIREDQEKTAAVDLGDPEMCMSFASLPPIDGSEVQEKLQTLAITDAVLRAELDAGEPVAVASVQSPREEDKIEDNLDLKEITEVLSSCQTSPMNVTRDEVFKLVSLLQKNMPELQITVLDCLVRIAAFTQNLTNLRESGCAEVITSLVQSSCQNIQTSPEAKTSLTALAKVLTNLSMDPKTQALLENTVPSLIDVLLLDSSSSEVQMSALRPLVNMSSASIFHKHYTRVVQQLYSLLDTGSHNIKVQSLKVLVNLSLNAELVQHLMAAKAPSCLLNLLDRPTPTDVLLRTTTVLANILSSVKEGQVTAASLPSEDKAESPLTVFSALFGVDSAPQLRNKIYRLTRHDDEDVCYQASKLYKFLSEVKK